MCGRAPCLSGSRVSQTFRVFSRGVFEALPVNASSRIALKYESSTGGGRVAGRLFGSEPNDTMFSTNLRDVTGPISANVPRVALFVISKPPIRFQNDKIGNQEAVHDGNI